MGQSEEGGDEAKESSAIREWSDRLICMPRFHSYEGGEDEAQERHKTPLCVEYKQPQHGSVDDFH